MNDETDNIQESLQKKVRWMSQLFSAANLWNPDIQKNLKEFQDEEKKQ